MSKPFNPFNLTFFMTMPTPCPYLPDRTERKLFTNLNEDTGAHINNHLTQAGFRRSQKVIYRPACTHCQACQSLRICSLSFAFRSSFKRILRKNQDLHSKCCKIRATKEQFNLLKAYIRIRHPDGDMANINYLGYKMMLEDCTGQAEFIEYRRDKDSELMACALVDRLSDGLSMLYSFFNPVYTDRGLGNFVILDHIQRCQNLNLPYLYLGYWVNHSPTMAYKARFQPCEIYTRHGWRSISKNLGSGPVNFEDSHLP